MKSARRPPYTPADLDWRNRQSRSSREMGDPGLPPGPGAAGCGPGAV